MKIFEIDNDQLPIHQIVQLVRFKPPRKQFFVLYI